MASRFTIQMDYNNAIGKADELDELAGRLNEVAESRMENNFSNLHTAWQCDNSDQYINKGRIIQDKIRDSKKQIENLSSVIRRVAKNIYDAEMEALRIAEERKAAEERAAAAVSGGGTAGGGGGSW